MTNKDIIKAVECCAEWDCCRCPYGLSVPNDKWTCQHRLMQEVAVIAKANKQRDERWHSLIGFINKQEGENNGD